MCFRRVCVWGCSSNYMWVLVSQFSNYMTRGLMGCIPTDVGGCFRALFSWKTHNFFIPVLQPQGIRYNSQFFCPSHPHEKSLLFMVPSKEIFVATAKGRAFRGAYDQVAAVCRGDILLEYLARQIGPARESEIKPGCWFTIRVTKEPWATPNRATGLFLKVTILNKKNHVCLRKNTKKISPTSQKKNRQKINE